MTKEIIEREKQCIVLSVEPDERGTEMMRTMLGQKGYTVSIEQNARGALDLRDLLSVAIRLGFLVVIMFAALPDFAVGSISPIGFTQVNFATSLTPQSTVTVTYTKAETAGNLNVVVVGWNDSTAHINSVADSKGNSYVLAVGPTVQRGSGVQDVRLWLSNCQAFAHHRTGQSQDLEEALAIKNTNIIRELRPPPCNPARCDRILRNCGEAN